MTKLAKGDFILTIDADMQHRTANLIKIYQELQNNDVVIGFRKERRKADNFVRIISSKVANYVRNKVLREDFRDAGCFLRGFRKDCPKGLILYRGMQVFIPSLMKMAGFRIKEIAVEVFPRRWGLSKYNIRNRLWKELLTLLIVRWMQKNRLQYKIKEILDN